MYMYMYMCVCVCGVLMFDGVYICCIDIDDKVYMNK